MVKINAKTKKTSLKNNKKISTNYRNLQDESSDLLKLGFLVDKQFRKKNQDFMLGKKDLSKFDPNDSPHPLFGIRDNVLRNIDGKAEINAEESAKELLKDKHVQNAVEKFSTDIHPEVIMRCWIHKLLRSIGVIIIKANYHFEFCIVGECCSPADFTSPLCLPNIIYRKVIDEPKEDQTKENPGETVEPYSSFYDKEHEIKENIADYLKIVNSVD